MRAMTASLEQRAGLVRRLTHYVPRGDFLRQLAHGLFFGKLNYALAAVSNPRLDDTGSPTVLDGAVQVAVNDVARALTGLKRSDHIQIPVLLKKAGIPSFNELAVRAVAIES
jgi:hypothetical protein